MAQLERRSDQWHERMERSAPQSDLAGDRKGFRRTFSKDASENVARCSAGEYSKRLEPSRPRGTSGLPAVWEHARRTGEEDATIANPRRARNRLNEKLRSLSHLPEWAFSPSMSNWAWWQARFHQVSKTIWCIWPRGCRLGGLSRC
jgi:hypothetical protein